MRQGSIGDQAQAGINFYMNKHSWNARSLDDDNQGDWDQLIVEFIRHLSDIALYYKAMYDDRLRPENCPEYLKERKLT